MEEEVQEYLNGLSNLLNGQLRGAINLKAREENLELIQLTFSDIFNKAFELGKASQAQEDNLEKLKKDLGITKPKNENQTEIEFPRD